MSHTKVFTVEEANSLLPDVEETFRHLAGMRAEIQRASDRLSVLDVLWGQRLMEPDNPDRKEFLEERAVVRRLVREVEEVVEQEFTARGIRFPPGGLENGLLDFPSTYEGRWVYLCWRRGEDEIVAWHELDGGFAGRKPLTAEHALRMGREDGPSGGGGKRGGEGGTRWA